jgi:hypothetical protein
MGIPIINGGFLSLSPMNRHAATVKTRAARNNKTRLRISAIPPRRQDMSLKPRFDRIICQNVPRSSYPRI